MFCWRRSYCRDRAAITLGPSERLVIGSLRPVDACLRRHDHVCSAGAEVIAVIGGYPCLAIANRRNGFLYSPTSPVRTSSSIVSAPSRQLQLRYSLSSQPLAPSYQCLPLSSGLQTKDLPPSLSLVPRIRTKMPPICPKCTKNI